MTLWLNDLGRVARLSNTTVRDIIRDMLQHASEDAMSLEDRSICVQALEQLTTH